MKDLFANYSKEVRPVIDKEQPIPVNFDMMFSQLVELVCMAGKNLFYGRVAFHWKNFSLSDQNEFLGFSFLYTLFHTLQVMLNGSTVELVHRDTSIIRTVSHVPIKFSFISSNTVWSSYGQYFVLFQNLSWHTALSEKFKKVNQFRYRNSQDTYFWDWFYLLNTLNCQWRLKVMSS